MRKFHTLGLDGSVIEVENPCLCSFGITEAIGAVIATISSTIASGATAIGIGAETAGIIGDVGAGALTGGALGAATDPRNPLKGLEEGAITGGFIGGGPAIGGALGIGTIGGDVLAGAAGGTLGGLATGENLGTAALGGAASGLLSGALSGINQPTGAAPTTGGGATSAPGAAAPASVGGAGADATSNIPGSVGTSLSSPSTTPGTVGVGAANGTPSLASGVNTPTNVGSASAPTVDPAAAVSSAPSFNSVPGNFTIQPTDFSSSLKAPSVSDYGSLGGGGIGSQIEPVNMTPENPAASSPSAFSGIGNFLKSPQGMLAVGGLGLDLLKGNQNPPGYSQLKGLAGTETALGAQNQTGILPAGISSGITSALSSAEATVRQQYANAGLSGSSSEAQDIASLKLHSAEQSAQIAMNLINTGVQQSELGANIYQELMNYQIQQDQEFGSAVSNFAGSLASISRPQQAATG